VADDGANFHLREAKRYRKQASGAVQLFNLCGAKLMVEERGGLATENPRVAGSIPALATISFS